MAFIPTSRKFYDEFTGLGGGGVKYLNALQGDKITCIIEGYFYWALTDSKLVFDLATQTISLTGLSINQSFITQGFNDGDTIEIVGSVSNNGTYTIDTVSDKYITIVEPLVDETAPSVSIYGTTLITAIDFLYDLIPNNSTKSDFISATDYDTVQRYSVSGLDAGTPGPIPLKIGTNSYGWVTDIVSGEDGEGTIEGVSNVDYKQSFKITQVFYMTRIWTNQLFSNFANRIAPNEFQKDNHLKHICKINGRFDQLSPITTQTGEIVQQNGVTGWFNQMNSQAKQEYSVVSISYQDNATLEVLQTLDASIVNLVTITLKSRSGKFVMASSQFILNHFLCPRDESQYINTDTTLLQNIRLDKAILISDDIASNGIELGTEYQSLTNIQVVNINADYVTITFNIDYSTETKLLLENKAVDDRYFAFFVSCQDVAITTSANIDRVNVLCDFNLAEYDTRDSTLFGLIDYIHCFTFPNYGVFESNDINGMQGDPAYVEIPFWVETAIVDTVSPTLQNITVEIVSTKTDEDDFIIESKVFDLSTIRKLDDKQTINVESERGFIFADESPWNRANVVRDADNDVGTKIAYKLQYAFALRYEEWLEVVQASTGASYDIFKDIEDVVQAWKRFNTGFGWALKFRMTAGVKGYDGLTTNFQTETTFNILEAGDTPDDGPTFKVSLKYYDEDGNEIDGILTDAPTRIVSRFAGDVSTYPTGLDEFNGYVFIDDEFGNTTSRRFASTDFDSEDDSPFSTDDLPTLNGIVSEFQSANLRASLFSNRIELDTWFTPDKTRTPAPYYFQPRINYQQGNIILQENGNAILQEDGFFILL